MSWFMRLNDYLDHHGIKRREFAARIGVSPQTITGWCDGTFWPGHDNALKVMQETGGAVTPTDFLIEPGETSDEPEAAA